MQHPAHPPICTAFGHFAGQLRCKRLKEGDLAEKLRTHVEQCDATSAMEQVGPLTNDKLRPRGLGVVVLGYDPGHACVCAQRRWV